MKYTFKSLRFTKLKSLSLEAYDKVIMLDTDILFRHCADDVFQKRAPAACRRHATGKYLDDEIIASKQLFHRRDRTQTGGINAGFVLT